MKLQHSDEYIAVCNVREKRRSSNFSTLCRARLYDLMLDHACGFGRYFTFTVERFFFALFSLHREQFTSVNLNRKLLKLLCRSQMVKVLI
jgi:hypothetical protein